MRGTQAKINEGERKYRIDAKARGKTRFISREVTGNVLTWFVALPAVQAFGNHGQVFSRSFVVTWLVLLPIFLFGGYLTGGWKWKGLGKKYPE